MALSRCLSAALLLAGADGARISRKKGSPTTLAGVPVHGYRADAEYWMVLFKEGTTNADIKDFCGGGRCNLMGNPDQGGVAFAQVRGVDHLEQMVSISSTKLEILEPDNTDYLIPEMQEEPEAASWGLDRVGVSTRTATGKGQTIYVQDTGVRTTHNDFGGRAFAALDMTSGSVVECAEDSTTCAVDRQGHGSHCAGSAAGTTFGVAPAATIRAVKTLSDQGSGARSWQMAAIDWITTTGAKPAVISMSLGGSGQDAAYTKAIGAATAAGLTVVVAAGNSNADACNFSPAFAADAITVGATTSMNERASYSNYGNCNNIMAPGSAITSAWDSSDSATNSISGTSMACPHVSGAAALLLEADPTLNRDQILAKFTEVGRTNLIEGLNRNDPDIFLWVGTGAAPTAAPTPPTPAPPPSICPEATSTGPDSDGDCRCNSGLYCYNSGESGCPFSYTGQKSTRWFSPTCTGCVCRSR